MYGHLRLFAARSSQITATSRRVRRTSDFSRGPYGDFCRTPGVFCRTPGVLCRPPEDFCRTPGVFCRTPGILCRTPEAFRRTPGAVRRTPGAVRRAPGVSGRPPGPPRRRPSPLARFGRTTVAGAAARAVLGRPSQATGPRQAPHPQPFFSPARLRADAPARAQGSSALSRAERNARKCGSSSPAACSQSLAAPPATLVRTACGGGGGWKLR